MSDPIRYTPSLETIDPDEPAARAAILETMRSIIETTTRDYGHSVRSVHAKSYALLEGELTVLPDLPGSLAQGLFARPATYPAVLRFSTNPGDILDDAVSAPRGLALKVIGVAGARLPGAEGATTQDFVMANGPAFAAPNAAKFLGNLKLLAATTDKAEDAKKAVSAALRAVNKGIEAAGWKSATVTNMGGQPLTHPLGESFYSQAPLRWGDHVAKVMVAPVSPELVALKDRPLALRGNPNALRQAAIDAMGAHGGEWEVRAQLCTDLETMPIEDASVEWDEAESPYVAVARIRVAAQPAWSEARAAQVDDGLSFSPWHGLAAHQPLGSINRARKPAYEAISEYRAEHNGCPVTEPRAALGLSSSPASAFGTTPGREGFRNAAPRPASASEHEGGMGAVAAGAVGGLAGGLLVSAMMLAKEAMTGEASDLVQLERKLERGPSTPGITAPASGREQATSHAGHLALSVASGALYGALKPKGARPVTAGLVFGMGFLALAYGGVGPAFRLTPPPRRDTAINHEQHLMVHAMFGVATALVADRVARSTR